MATLTVGPGQQFSTIAAAINISNSGDTIRVVAGTYTNDFATITHSLQLQAVGGRVTVLATVPPTNLKGILTIGGTPSDNPNVSITGFTFAGAAISSSDGNNGAGIRYQAGNLTLKNCVFHDNQDGILATPFSAGTGNITINQCIFRHNGAGDGQSHNMYIGPVAKLTVENSLIYNARVGHELKSRAKNSTITNNRIYDGPHGTASYSIDLPNGGNAFVQGNSIEQGPLSQNPIIISYGEEGNLWSNSTLAVDHNTILNDLSSPNALGLRDASNSPASFTNSSIFGLSSSQLVAGSVSLSGTHYLMSEPALNYTAPWAP